jgi:dTMP kinase
VGRSGAGRLIALEGPDGVGKSTQVARLQAYLAERGRPVVVVREPGGTPVGERLRAILLDPAVDMAPVTEMLLFAASRAEVVARVVRPALEAGTVVIMDRYVESSLAYQGYGLGVDREAIWAVNHVATGGLVPDCTVVLWGLGWRETGHDRVEGRSRAFRERVREGYRNLASEWPHIHLVPADLPVEEVWQRVRSIIGPVLGIEEASR